MRKTIRAQILTVFITAIAFTIVACLLLNHFFLKGFYNRKKQQSIVSSYKTISAMIDAGTSEKELRSFLTAMRDDKGIAFIRTSSSWNLDDISENGISKLQAQDMRDRLMFYILMGTPSLPGIETGDNYILQKYHDLTSGTDFIECYGMFSDNSFFIMSSPLSAISDSAQISNEFFLIVLVCTIVPAVIFILLMTKRITRPIRELAGLSDKMAALDFSEHFNGDFSSEINELGQSMNSMSEQLKSTIDELKEANDRLTRDIREKIEIDELRKEFLSNVSHELKTPIALIQGYAEGLQDIPDEDKESRDYYCDVIIDESDKMNRMVKKLLTLNHLEFGQDALVTEDFDLCEMLDGLLSAQALAFQKQGITLKKAYPPSCMVCADVFKIEEVCTNYLSNAVNHAEGDKVITVSLEDEGDQVRVTVENTGKPIPEESLDLVWQKFYKVDKARTREYGGSGIGLSIVRAIMEAHHKAYGVSNTDSGVAFYFCLDKAQGNEPGKEEVTEDGSDH